MASLKSGDNCYFDGFGGLIACKVLSITGNSGFASSAQDVTLKVTAKTGRGYTHGEVIHTSGLHAIPKGAVKGNRILSYTVYADGDKESKQPNPTTYPPQYGKEKYIPLASNLSKLDAMKLQSHFINKGVTVEITEGSGRMVGKWTAFIYEGDAAHANRIWKSWKSGGKLGNPTPTINWNLIIKLPADGKVYKGGPEYGAFEVKHSPATTHNVETVFAETGDGLHRRRLVPVKGKPSKWAVSEHIVGHLPKLSNPGSLSSSEKLFSSFHGRDAESVDDIVTIESIPGSLAQLGELRELCVLSEDGKEEIPVVFDELGRGIVVLASAPGGTQYVLVGGDQSLPLETLSEDFGIEEWGDDWKRKVVLGEITRLTYFADKHHLSGPKYQKKGCLYEHELGEEGGELPTLVYDPNNESLEIVGGSYVTKEEGIRN